MRLFVAEIGGYYGDVVQCAGRGGFGRYPMVDGYGCIPIM